MPRSTSEKIDHTVLYQGCHGQFLVSIKQPGLDIWKKVSIKRPVLFIFFKFQKPSRTRSYNRDLRVRARGQNNSLKNVVQNVYFQMQNIWQNSHRTIFQLKFKIWKSILNFLPMVKVSKFPLPSIDTLTRNPSIRIYMAPKIPIISPPWARIVPKIYTCICTLIEIILRIHTTQLKVS